MDGLHFLLYPLRLIFHAREAFAFPEGGAGNRLRGAFGASLHRLEQAALFEPSSDAGPSGLADRPRPFVFRAAHLDGRALAPGDTFHFDFHWFDLRRDSLQTALRALAGSLREAELVDIGGDDAPLQVCLDAPGDPVRRIVVRFETPTELKAAGEVSERPEFATLAARARDRVSTLRALYGDGPLALDFRQFGERATKVRMVRCEIEHVETSRRSARTGRIHPLNGFIGEAEYEGDLTEFVPLLCAARWTGVGRQTAWGKGAIAVTKRCPPAP